MNLRPSALPSLILLAAFPASSADFGEHPIHSRMPERPTDASDYQSMWDPFALRTAPSGVPLEVVAESGSSERLMAAYDTGPWNGRQIARDAAGNWFVLAEQGGSVFLAAGPGKTENPYRPRGGDLPAFELVGKGENAVLRAEGGGSLASMVVGGDDHLHVVFHRSDGLWHTKARVEGGAVARLVSAEAWTRPARLVEGACRAGDLLREASGGVAICYAKDDTVYYRALSAERPETVAGRSTGLPALRQFAGPLEPLEDDAAAPGLGTLQRTGGKIPLSECESQDAVMDLAPDGEVWLAFRRDFGIWVARRGTDGRWSPPELVVREYAYHPSLIVADGRPLLAYHHDGLRQHPLDLGTDLRQRAGGASALGYAVLAEDGWRTGTLALPEEVAVHRRGMWAKRGAGRLLPQIEQFGWPVLFRDPHGVVWALWQNKTRRWAYRARWTGEGFGETQECRGPFNAPRLPVNAEKLAPSDAEDVGLLFHAAAAGGENRVLFDRLRIPSLSTADEREVLFLDGLEVAQTSGVERILNEMEKPIRQPSLSPGEGSRVVLNPSVTKRGDTWVMGYTSAFESGEGGSGQGWAVSADGFRFRTVDQLPDGLPEAERFPSRPLDYWRGSEKTRPPPHYPNPDANDPAKKFLRLGFSTDARGSYWLEHSPDGRQWTRGPALTAPEAMRERAQPGFYDAEDPERPIRTYSRVYTETGRSWGVIWTRDLTHWSGLEHLLDPDDPYGKEPEMDRIGTTGKDYTMRGQIFLDAVAGKNEDEIYAAIVRHAEGLYFCFYWPGQQGRPLADVGIAVSRDGFNYSRVKNGERILSLGPPGAWDSGYIFQMSPLFDGETLRVYYRGTAGRREGTDGFEHNLTEIGVATIRANGFTFYRPRATAQPGSVTTIPIRSPAGAGRKLAVNLEGLATPSAAFAVEVLDAATGQALDGFSAADCLPPGGDGLAVPVAWKGGAELPAGRDIRLRFHLRGRDLRFYSFGFR